MGAVYVIKHVDRIILLGLASTLLAFQASSTAAFTTWPPKARFKFVLHFWRVVQKLLRLAGRACASADAVRYHHPDDLPRYGGTQAINGGKSSRDQDSSLVARSLGAQRRSRGLSAADRSCFEAVCSQR